MDPVDAGNTEGDARGAPFGDFFWTRFGVAFSGLVLLNAVLLTVDCYAVRYANRRKAHAIVKKVQERKQQLSVHASEIDSEDFDEILESLSDQSMEEMESDLDFEIEQEIQSDKEAKTVDRGEWEWPDPRRKSVKSPPSPTTSPSPQQQEYRNSEEREEDKEKDDDTDTEEMLTIAKHRMKKDLKRKRMKQKRKHQREYKQFEAKQKKKKKKKKRKKGKRDQLEGPTLPRSPIAKPIVFRAMPLQKTSETSDSDGSKDATDMTHINEEECKDIFEAEERYLRQFYSNYGKSIKERNSSITAGQQSKGGNTQFDAVP